jgi:hypothetical protein
MSALWHSSTSQSWQIIAEKIYIIFCGGLFSLSLYDYLVTTKLVIACGEIG